MRHIDSTFTTPLPYVETITVELSANNVDTIVLALQRTGDWHDNDIASALQRYVSDAAYISEAKRVCETGALDHYIVAGQHITAIKYLRALTTCGLKTAKDACDNRRTYLRDNGKML